MKIKIKCYDCCHFYKSLAKVQDEQFSTRNGIATHACPIFETKHSHTMPILTFAFFQGLPIPMFTETRGDCQSFKEVTHYA